jgi:diguanylate cyclase (GGDEF)-like protein
MQRAEAWRSAVERLSIAHGNFRLTFTISLGVSAYPDHGKTPDELTRCADQALYKAKHDGRNRVVIHTTELGGIAAPKSPFCATFTTSA